MAGLSLQNIDLGYGSHVLLRQVNLEIGPGEFCVLQGPNGSGKSTLLRVALGLMQPLSGSVQRGFTRPAQVPQFSPQAQDRQFPMSIQDLLATSYRLKRPWQALAPAARLAYREESAAILQRIGLWDKRTQLLRESSGGEVQRAMIARALMLRPDFLVLDEPTASIDQAGKAAIRELLQRLHAEDGVAVLLTSHEFIAESSSPNPSMRVLRIVDDRLLVDEAGEAAASDEGVPA